MAVRYYSEETSEEGIIHADGTKEIIREARPSCYGIDNLLYTIFFLAVISSILCAVFM